MKKLKLWSQFSLTFDLLVKRLEARFLQYNHRRLHLQTSGRLYVLFTIILGVAAIMANNNLLFLLESFLLGGLILSGVLSEYAISNVEVRWLRNPTFSGELSHDTIHITNKGLLPLICVEIGEWKNDTFIPSCFISILKPSETISMASRQIFLNRGLYSYQGWAVETSYPFGFAKKLRWYDLQGQRIIWPSRGAQTKAMSFINKNRFQKSQEYQEGEIDTCHFDADIRKIAFSKSLATGEIYTRQIGNETFCDTWILDVDRLDAQNLENEISYTTNEIFEQKKKYRPRLKIIKNKKNSNFEGIHACLNALSLLKKNI